MHIEVVRYYAHMYYYRLKPIFFLVNVDVVLHICRMPEPAAKQRESPDMYMCIYKKSFLQAYIYIYINGVYLYMKLFA